MQNKQITLRIGQKQTHLVARAVFENRLNHEARFLVRRQTYFGTSQFLVNVVDQDVLFFLFLCVVQHALNLHDISDLLLSGVSRAASVTIRYCTLRCNRTSFLRTFGRKSMKRRFRCFLSFFECHMMWIVFTLSDGMNLPRLGTVSSQAPARMVWCTLCYHCNRHFVKKNKRGTKIQTLFVIPYGFAILYLSLKNEYSVL